MDDLFFDGFFGSGSGGTCPSPVVPDGGLFHQIQESIVAPLHLEHFQELVSLQGEDVAAIVRLGDPDQEYSNGDREVVRGRALFSVVYAEKILKGTQVMVRGGTYRIDSVGDVQHGLIPVRLVRGTESYSNLNQLDPI